MGYGRAKVSQCVAYGTARRLDGGE